MRALISVSDKTGVVEFAKGLRTLGWEVIATGGTMKLLADSGVEVINISDVTGFPEICDGRVKTLHPNVHGGLLVQDLDVATKAVTADMCVTKAKPAAEQMEDLNFGWHIVKHVKSNAIVAVKDGRTLGVGAGQMNRIGSAEIALKQAHAAGVTEGLVLASDGFFPFDDCVTLAAEYGVTAIVQPGGSVRDEDSIRKADEKGIAMVFTGERHFKH